MSKDGKSNRTNLNDSMIPKSGSRHSANPKSVDIDSMKKNFIPKVHDPDGTSDDQASTQPVSALPKDGEDPPPAHED